MKRMTVRRVIVAMLLGVVVKDADASPSDLFTDTFQRTTGLGSSWAVWYGGFSTDGACAVSAAPPTRGNWAGVAGSLGTNDYAVTTDIILPAGSIDSGVVARSSNAAYFDHTLYAAQLWTDGSVNLYRRNAWTWTLLSTVQAGIVANTSYTLTLVTTGDSPVHLEVWVNGTQKISYDDDSATRITSGACGMQNYNVNVKYTNFRVQAIPHRIFSDVFARTTGLGPNWQVARGGFTTNGTYAISGSE